MKGVNPMTTRILEIECMGCFEKTKAWDNEAELEAFRVMRGYKDEGAELNMRVLRREWAEWKGAMREEDQDRADGKYKFAVECRHGCGVVYCPVCMKASRRRMRKERVAADVE